MFAFARTFFAGYRILGSQVLLWLFCRYYLHHLVLNVALEKSEACLHFLLFNVISVCLGAPKICPCFLPSSLPHLRFPCVLSDFLSSLSLSPIQPYRICLIVDSSGSFSPGLWCALLIYRVKFCLIYSASHFLVSSLWSLNNYVYVRSPLPIVAVSFYNPLYLYLYFI